MNVSRNIDVNNNLHNISIKSKIQPLLIIRFSPHDYTSFLNY